MKLSAARLFQERETAWRRGLWDWTPPAAALLGSALFSEDGVLAALPHKQWPLCSPAVRSQKETAISSSVYLWGQARGRRQVPILFTSEEPIKTRARLHVNPLLSLSTCYLGDWMANVFPDAIFNKTITVFARRYEMAVGTLTRLVLTNHRTHTGRQLLNYCL